MEVFHPSRRAFWMPFTYGLIAGLAGFLFGWGVDKFDGAVSGTIIGSLLFFLVWLPFAVAWDRTLRRSYEPARVEPVHHPSEADLDDFDPARIPIKCYSRGDGTTHYLIDLPTEYWQLQKFAEGIERDKKTTAYSEWSGAEAGGFVWNDDKDYRMVIKWLCDYGYGLLDRGNKLVITENGHDLFEDLLNLQFEPAPLSELGYRRNIRQYPNTDK